MHDHDLHDLRTLREALAINLAAQDTLHAKLAADHRDYRPAAALGYALASLLLLAALVATLAWNLL
jgi:hypothetical protein